MAVVDYGAILKTNGEVKNLNNGLFMDMEEAVGFSLKTVKHSYTYKGKEYSRDLDIDGNYFVYFGDKDVLFCVYKCNLLVIENMQTPKGFGLSSDGRKKVLNTCVNGANIKIKEIAEGKFHATIQYKGNNYQVLYGYGIDTNYKMFKTLSKEHDYGYNKKVTKYVKNFLNKK